MLSLIKSLFTKNYSSNGKGKTSIEIKHYNPDKIIILSRGVRLSPVTDFTVKPQKDGRTSIIINRTILKKDLKVVHNVQNYNSHFYCYKTKRFGRFEVLQKSYGFKNYHVVS